MTIEETIKFIKIAHKNQVDKCNQPYWLHPVAVMESLPEDSSNERKKGALLHDILEDTKYTENNLKFIGFSNKEIEIVKLVSKLDQSQTYIEWIQSICDSNNMDAIIVKKYDILHNMHPDRKFEGGETLINRYKKALKLLNQKLIL
jgi:(p)ppGpp synthase/HD superfamily hydrolase|tara:strand:- start:629 stop:1066 length:438 start_codon:yes stop_codon:yes gene_type:complete